jgi:DNA-binding MarR family transcriptional regulator
MSDLDQLLVDVVRTVGMEQSVVVGGETISLPESFVLRELLAAKELSQQDLADRLRADKSRISRIASQLETRGWVVRERVPENRRLYRVRLTRQGAQLGRRMERLFRRRHAELFDAMTAKERAALRTGLTGLLRAVRELHPTT